MKAQARTSKAAEESFSGGRFVPLSRDTQIEQIAKALRASVSEQMATMLHIPTIAEQLFFLGVRVGEGRLTSRIRELENALQELMSGGQCCEMASVGKGHDPEYCPGFRVLKDFALPEKHHER